MTKDINNKKEIISFVCNFSDAMKKQNWVSQYDPEADSLSLSVKKLPKDAKIQYFGDEFAFYLTKDNKIKGVFVEYFKTNFINHHNKAKNIRKFYKNIEKKTKECDKNLIKIDKKLSVKTLKEFEDAMLTSLATNMELQKAE